MAKSHTIIVDDDPVLVFMLQKMIINNGLNDSPISFEDGLQALTYLKENYTVKDNYIILLDINMPEMNGWEFLDVIQSFVNDTNVFVFIVSSSINQGDKDKAKQYSLVISYLEKPIFNDALEFIKTQVNKRLNS